MGKLIDINREGGFPLCAETLGILDENSRLLESVLSTLITTTKSAVLLGNGYVYINCPEYRGIAKIANDSHVLLNSVKLVFGRTEYDVTHSNGQEIERVYSVESVTIEPTSNLQEQWTVFRMNELLELKMMRNLLPTFETSLSSALCTSGFYQSNMPELIDEHNVFETNATRCRMRLALSVYFNAATNCMLTIPMPIDGNFPLNASLELVPTGKSDPIHACIKNGQLEVDLGRWVKDHNTTSSTFDTIIRINSDLVL